MPERTRSLLLAVVLIVMTGAVVFLVATGPTDIDRVEAIGQRIKCPVCQGESIADSPAEMARDMMDLVSERVDAGFADDAIIDELLASFSGAVLLDPPATGPTLVLWLAPLGAFAVGLGVIWWWRRHAGDTQDESSGAGPSKVVSRVVLPMVIVAMALGVAALITTALMADGQGAASGVADLADQELDDVSNETLEAVIEANADHPAIDGMRLALAERYFEVGDYSSAFPHYLAVARSEIAQPEQVVAALVSLGWMVWSGNGEAERAIELFDEALTIDPGSYTAKYLKGEVLWCGLDAPDEAVVLFQEALDDPDLSSESRTRVETSLTAAAAGEACR